ncbi:MAG: hypothetical protein ACXVUE_22380 [Solirubrobacteraceae bacterium]
MGVSEPIANWTAAGVGSEAVFTAGVGDGSDPWVRDENDGRLPFVIARI